MNTLITPQINMTQAAKDAVMAAKDAQEEAILRLEISDSMEHNLTFETRKDNDISVDMGAFVLVMDQATAQVADNVEIDYVNNEERSGFKIENPNKKKPIQILENKKEVKSNGEAIFDAKIPTFEVTSNAHSQFVTAIKEEVGGGTIGIMVTARRMGADSAEYELDVISEKDRPKESFEVIQNDIAYWIPKLSAANLESAVVDFVETEQGAGFKFSNEFLKGGWNDDRATRFEELLEKEINPGIAAHGGYVRLLDLQGDTAYVLMGGGCQGCNMAGVTLEQGISDLIRKEIPSIVNILDNTDHSSGQNPYYGNS